MNAADSIFIWAGRVYVGLTLVLVASLALTLASGWLRDRRNPPLAPRTPEPDDTQEFPAYQDGFDVLAERFADRKALNAELDGIWAASQNTPDIDSADYWPGAA